jgi:hypothetical protein
MIRLDDHTDVLAYTPIYEGQNLIVASTLQEKAAMVKSAVGRLVSLAAAWPIFGSSQNH